MGRIKNLNKYIFITVIILALYFSLIGLWPFLFNLFLSFTKTNLLTDFKFYGLDNYRFLIKDPVFWVSLRNTILYLITNVSIGIITSLIIAALIYRTYGFSKKLYTAMYFTPVVTSMVAVSLIWKLLYFPKIGILSIILTKFFGMEPQLFLSDHKVALLCVILMDIWKDTGLRTVILIAGMEGISDSIYEASRIDGASPLTQFFKITLPLLRRQIIFLIAIYSINSIRVFKQIFMMTGSPPGGPGNSTKTLVVYLYETGFRSLRFGYSTTIAIVIFLLLFGLVLFQITSFEKRFDY